MRSTSLLLVPALSFCLLSTSSRAQGSKPTITLDEYLNTTEILGYKPLSRRFRSRHLNRDARLEGQHVSP